jgi:hypothetical protein
MQKLIVALLLLPISSTFAQTKHPKTKEEIVAVCNKFMDAFKAGDYGLAFGTIKPYTVIEPYKLDTITGRVRTQMATAIRTYGKVNSYEEVAEKQIKGSVLRLVYLLKFDKFFLKVVFILYNNGSGWSITSFDYSENVDELFISSLEGRSRFQNLG